MRYIDTNGNEWENAETALNEFISDLPFLSEEESELVFQFTHYNDDAATNLRAIEQGIACAGLNARFEGDNYPVPTPADTETE